MLLGRRIPRWGAIIRGSRLAGFWFNGAVSDAPYLQPFVVDIELVPPKRVGSVDLYLPAAGAGAPLVVLVHGGPMRNPPSVPASQWPVYQGYAGLLSAHHVAVAMFDHGLLNGDEEAAPGDLRAAIATAQGADGVDGSRVVLWFFSGGGLLSPTYLSAPPGWLRGVALSYPALDDDDPDWDPRAALHPGLAVPLLLTRVGHENPGLVEGQAQFVDKARRLSIPLDLIDIPHGRHAFDCAEPFQASQDAIRTATRWVLKSLS